MKYRIIYLEYSEESICKLLESMSEFSKVARNKVIYKIQLHFCGLAINRKNALKDNIYNSIKTAK